MQEKSSLSVSIANKESQVCREFSVQFIIIIIKLIHVQYLSIFLLHLLTRKTVMTNFNTLLLQIAAIRVEVEKLRREVQELTAEIQVFILYLIQ